MRAEELLAEYGLPTEITAALLEPFDDAEGVNAYTLSIRLSMLFEEEPDVARIVDSSPELRTFLCDRIRDFPRSPQDTVKKWFQRLDAEAQRAIRLGAQLGRTFPIELAAKGSSEVAERLESAVVDHGFLQPGRHLDAAEGTEAHFLRSVKLNDLTYGWLADNRSTSGTGRDPRLVEAVTTFVRRHLEAVATQPVASFQPMFMPERTPIA
jgi:hypothetical protein